MGDRIVDLVGIGLIVAGVWWVAPALGLVFAGLAVLVLHWLWRDQ